MGDLVNLKRARKRIEREQSEKAAAARRARFGRTKSERDAEAASAQRASRVLDQHFVEGEDV